MLNFYSSPILKNIVFLGLTLIGVLFDGLVCYLGTDLNLYEDDDDEDSNKNSVAPAVKSKPETLPVPDGVEKT